MGKVKTWLDNARFAATMQSLLPAIMAAVLAIGNPDFNWILAILAVIGVNMAHCAMNIIDDYYDYKIEMLEARIKVVRRGFKAYTEKYPYLTSGAATMKDTRWAIAAFGGIALACGLVIFVWRTVQFGFFGPQGSWWIVAAVAITAFLGFFYSAPPLKLSFIGLGELVVGIIFGPMLMVGAYYSAAGAVDSTIWFLSIPVGMFVMNILFTHSIIDSVGDEESEKLTLATLLKKDWANLTVSAILNFAPFVIVAAGVAAGMLHWAYLFSLIVVPRAIWLFWSLVKFVHGESIDENRKRWFLGQMPDWNKIVESGLSWYLIRWMTARNIVTGFSFILVIVKIVLLFVK